MGLPGSEDSLTIGWAVSTQYQRVTDKRPAYVNNVRSMTDVKNEQYYDLSTVIHSALYVSDQ